MKGTTKKDCLIYRIFNNLRESAVHFLRNYHNVVVICIIKDKIIILEKYAKYYIFLLTIEYFTRYNKSLKDIMFIILLSFDMFK